MVTSIAAWTGLILLAAVSVLQIMLAAGAPLGRFAFGGRYEGSLPGGLRAVSAAALVILGIGAFYLMVDAGILTSEDYREMAGVGTWVYAGFFLLNALANVSSRSRVETLVMTPVAALLCACFAVVAWSS